MNPGTDFELQDIKSEPIYIPELKAMAKLAGSYEALFSRRSTKFRPMGLHLKNLSEDDYRDLILEEYTFLKRPVILLGDSIFIGNSKNTLAAASNALA